MPRISNRSPRPLVVILRLAMPLRSRFAIRTGLALGFVAAFGTAFTTVPATRAVEAEAAASAEKRLADSTRFLADDALEGRGVGTAGIDKAADYLAEQFAALGLNTKLYDGTPFQKFKMPIGSELGEPNVLSFTAPGEGKEKSIGLKLGENFTPLALGGSSNLEVPLVFVGYGVTAKDKDYDDYEDVNVDGKRSSCCGDCRKTAARTRPWEIPSTRATRPCFARFPTPTSTGRRP